MHPAASSSCGWVSENQLVQLLQLFPSLPGRPCWGPGPCRPVLECLGPLCAGRSWWGTGSWHPLHTQQSWGAVSAPAGPLRPLRCQSP